MGRFFDTLLAQPVADDDPAQQRLAEALAEASTGTDADAEGGVPALLQQHLDMILQPCDPLVMRIADALDRSVAPHRQIAIWRDLRARYPADALVVLLELRAVLAAAESAAGHVGEGGSGHGGPDDPNDPDDTYFEIREHYSELLEHYADNEPATAELQALGRIISSLEERDFLPRVMVRRGAWRRPE